MMITIRIMVDVKTYLRLEAIAADRYDHRADDVVQKIGQVRELAENAVSEAALGYFQDRGMRGDPL